ncbi:hypothetical protein [Photobacterium lipolyticum]|uniref:Uncharacterized protein n=1 Tax=Photobacterium lipolyticum TaxID=266810 RepID=A0A2T3MPI8_9GAMM|nr:hypothetical protein [Photobacterium lipolyticum]PSV98856.1 hypothetical protein C9I89_22010 [Photobacterium lipolyticum]
MKNKKIFTIISVLILSVLGLFLSVRVYSIYSINKVIAHNGGVGNINRLKERKVNIIGEFSSAHAKIELDFVMINTEFMFEKVNPIGLLRPNHNLHVYYYEEGDVFKSITIMNGSKEPSLVDGFMSYNNDKRKLQSVIGEEYLRSDYELTTFFYGFQPDSVNFLSTLDDIQIAMASMVFRSVYIPFYGNLYSFNLDNKYRGLQFGEADSNRDVRVNVYDKSKLLIKFVFHNMTQKEVDFALSTMEVKNQPDL